MPEVVEANQGGGCIGTTATETTAHGEFFIQVNVGPLAGAGSFLQAAGRPNHQVLLGRHPWQLRSEGDNAIIPWVKGERVAIVQELEQRLQLVVAVGTAAGDMQEQVELGRRGQRDVRASEVRHGQSAEPGCHDDTTSRTSFSPLRAVSRAGNSGLSSMNARQRS